LNLNKLPIFFKAIKFMGYLSKALQKERDGHGIFNP